MFCVLIGFLCFYLLKDLSKGRTRSAVFQRVQQRNRSFDHTGDIQPHSSLKPINNTGDEPLDLSLDLSSDVDVAVDVDVDASPVPVKRVHKSSSFSTFDEPPLKRRRLSNDPISVKLYVISLSKLTLDGNGRMLEQGTSQFALYQFHLLSIQTQADANNSTTFT